MGKYSLWKTNFINGITAGTSSQVPRRARGFLANSVPTILFIGTTVDGQKTFQGIQNSKSDISDIF